MKMKLNSVLFLAFNCLVLISTTKPKRLKKHHFGSHRHANQKSNTLEGSSSFVSIQNFTFVAGLVLLYQHYTHYVCGATIIENFWAITAAHCLEYDILKHAAAHGKLVVRSGATFIRATAGYDHHIVGFKIHENYRNDLQYDIAIIKVKDPFVEETEKPIALIASPKYTYKDGSAAGILGWERATLVNEPSEKLSHSEVNLISNVECANAYKRNRSLFFTNIWVCTMSSGSDVCQGDSGGPLFQDNVLIGVIASLANCADFRAPAIYIRVSEFYDWIQKKMTKQLNVD